MNVKLAWYDWIVVNSSAGKDSQAMLDVVCKAAQAAGVLDRVVVVHCDLGEEEWKGTRELAEEQARTYGVRFEVVRRAKGGLLQHTMDRHAALTAAGKHTAPWPSSTARWCTSDHKRDQVAVLFTKLARELKGRGRRVRILNCMGMRAGESCTRAELRPFKLDRRASNSRRTVHTWLPIHAWTVDQVWERIGAAGTRHHYAYDLGMPRLSCCFCIFAPKAALMLAGRHNPELLDRYVEVEQKTGFAFRQSLPLLEVREALRRGEEAGPIVTWEM